MNKYMKDDTFSHYRDELKELAEEVDLPEEKLASVLHRINDLKAFFNKPMTDLFLNEYVLNERR